MKPEHLYQGLKELAAKIGIQISEQRLSAMGFKAKSGLCIIKGQRIMFLDKQLSIHIRNSILADVLNDLPHESVYAAPAVRDFLMKRRTV